MRYVQSIKNKWPFIFLIFFWACRQQGPPKKPLLKVKDRILYLEDIPEEIWAGKSREDSILAVENYMNRWIQATLLADYARKNVDTSYVNRLVKAYKQSLIVELYENQLAEKIFDTITFNEEELKKYYQLNKNHFIAQDTLIKWRALILNPDDKNRWKYKKMFFSRDSSQLLQLEQHYSDFIFYKPDTNGWQTMESLRNIFPRFKLSKKNKTKQMVFSGKDKFYLIDLLNVIYPGEIMPYDHAKDRIITFVKKRKTFEALKKIKTEMVKEAIKRKEIKKLKK